MIPQACGAMRHFYEKKSFFRRIFLVRKGKKLNSVEMPVSGISGPMMMSLMFGPVVLLHAVPTCNNTVMIP
jgi:hypothetical protein